MVETEKEVEGKVRMSVIFAIFDEQGDIYLEKRRKPGDKYFGFTTVPGGHVEPFENTSGALVREIDEEFGFKPKNGWTLLGSFDTKEDFGIERRFVFLVKEKSENLKLEDNQLKTSLGEAWNLCKHPISQKILSMVDGYLNPRTNLL